MIEGKEIPHPPFADKMQRYHAEIERNLYAAEVLCPYAAERKEKNDRGWAFVCPNPCAFVAPGEGSRLCTLFGLRLKIGDHIQQDDPTEPGQKIGVCEHAEPDAFDYLCMYNDGCEYQATRDGRTFYCTREAAALAALEVATAELIAGLDDAEAVAGRLK